MSIIIFILLSLVTAAAIVYPLLPGSEPGTRDLPGREDRSRAGQRATRQPPGGPTCPSCGRQYVPGDRFCMGCGEALSGPGERPRECPSCGGALREADRFCARCGLRLPDEVSQ